MNKQLPSLENLLEQSYQTFKPRIGYYAILSILISLLVFVIIGIEMMIGFVTIIPSILNGFEITRTFILLMIVFIFSFFFLSAWTSASLFTAITTPEVKPVFEILKIGLQKTPRVLQTTVLRTLLLIAGLALFILPGIYLWGKTLFIELEATEGASPFTALRRSWNFSSGRWFSVAGPIIIVTIVITFISMIAGYIGTTASFISSIFMTAIVSPWAMVLIKTIRDHARSSEAPESMQSVETA